MTISSTASEISYAGNGATVAFAIPFPFDTSADIKVTSTVTATGDVSVLSSGFAITGGGGSTGTITFTTAPASTVSITLIDDPARTQPTDYVANDAFPAESHERALDRVTRLCKRLYQRSLRSLRVPDGDPVTDAELAPVSTRKGKYLFFDAVTGAIDYATAIATTTLSQGTIGALLYPRTAAEISAGVTPTNYAYPPGDVRRYGADPTGSADSTTAITNALAANMLVRVPTGTYKITSTLTLPPYGVLQGDGINNSNLIVYADQVAIVTQYWSQVRGLNVSKSGAHTKNLIEVGSTALDSGRAVIADTLVTGAGNDGIQLIHGNLGQLQNVVVTLCGRDGINFKAGNIDLNAWATSGYIDVRGNTRDGFHVDQGSSLGDSAVSVTNTFVGITSQENGRYGIFIGTRSNCLYGGYGELNTTADIYLGSYARGNRVSVLQGTVVDASAEPSFNMVEDWNASAGYQRTFQNRILFSGVATAGWSLYNNDGTAGTLSAFKVSAGTYKFQADSTSANQVIGFENAVATYVVNFKVDGEITAGAVTGDSSLSGRLNAYFNGSAANGQDLQDTNSTNGGTFARFLIGAKGAGSAIGSITRNAATSAVLYNTTSDGRLKNVQGPLADAGELLDAIRVYDFTWKEGGAQDRGVIAQELKEVIPQAVHVPNDPDEHLGVDYSKLVPLLVAEVQSLRKRVSALEVGA